MQFSLNISQRKALSQFFISIAVAWFVGAFITPQIAPEFGPLTLIRYIGNMFGAILLSLYFLKEEI